MTKSYNIPNADFSAKQTEEGAEMSDLIVQNSVLGNRAEHELPRCVYCGGYEFPDDDESYQELCIRIHNNGGRVQYNVECGHCRARGPKAATEKKAVELYCRRYSPGLVKEVEAQKKALKALDSVGLTPVKGHNLDNAIAAYNTIKKYIEEH